MSGAVTGAIVFPLFILLMVVAPMWLGMHYSAKKQRLGALDDDQAAELERLSQAAERMGQRIETLEAILDAETPGWRTRAGRNT